MGHTPSLRVSADAVDLNGPVTLVDFYLDDQKAGSTTTIQHGTLGTFVTYLTTRPVAGPYQLTAVAYNGAGESTVSSAVGVAIAVPPPRRRSSPAPPLRGPSMPSSMAP